jgi:hypothetical protein
MKRGGIASYVAIHIEYFVTVVDSNGLAAEKPYHEPTDQEDEIGQPQREE